MQALNFDIGEIVPALRAPGNLPSVQSKQADRDEIAWLTQQFLARGGQITHGAPASTTGAGSLSGSEGMKKPPLDLHATRQEKLSPAKPVYDEFGTFAPALAQKNISNFVRRQLPSLPAGPQGGEQLLLDVRAGLLSQSCSLTVWCRNKGISYSSAVGCLTHLRPRAAGLILRQQLLAAAGIKEGS